MTKQPEEEHVSEKPLGSDEYDLPGLGKCEEVIEERIDPTDGTPIDHITYKPMVGSPLFFGGAKSKKYLENLDKIDWSKG